MSPWAVTALVAICEESFLYQATSGTQLLMRQKTSTTKTT